MVWADATNDVLVLGATGFVGRLITRYLCSHRQRKLFRLALAARSEEKLKKLVEEENVGEKVDELVTVDVTDPASVERAVRKARVVINAVGPYWLYGTPVVEYVLLFDETLRGLESDNSRPFVLQSLCPQPGALC